MKKVLSLICAAAVCTSVLASCQSVNNYPKNISVTSSDAEESAVWLANRLGEDSHSLVIGTGNSAGLDMSDFEDDGYVIRSVNEKTVICGKTSDGLDLAVRRYAHSAEKGDKFADVSYHEGNRIEKLTVAGADISKYIVFYPENANENMRFAVSEFTRLVKKACGAELKTVQGDPTGEYTVEFRFDTSPELKSDGYRYSVNGTHLVFSGAVKRGCMYAVWRFLQNECGWEGLIYGESVLPESDHVDIPDKTEKSETPAFECLELVRDYIGKYKNDRRTPTDAQNSYGTIVSANHGMQNNYFCDENYYVRQICYSDEDRYQECLENVKIYIEDKLASGCVIGEDFLCVDISQGDTVNFCNCSKCMKAVKKDGGNSGPVVVFANRLSEELNEIYPGLMYQILAYAGTNEAPKVTKPNEFIHVSFCADMNCSNHPFDGSECGDGAVLVNGRKNTSYASWLKGWSDLTKNLYVWYYDLDTGLQQYSSIHTIKKNFQYFNDLGLSGVGWQCQFYGLGIQRVQHQLATELNWNINMTDEEYEALLCSILEREYGSEWENIREYIDLWESSQLLEGCWQCWGWAYLTCWDTRYSIRDYAKKFDHMFELFEETISGADSKAQEIRGENLSCHMIYEGCYSSYFTALENGDSERVKTLSDRYELMMSRLNKNGFDPCGDGIITVDWTKNVYSPTLSEAGEKDWASMKERLLAGRGGANTEQTIFS